VRVAFAHYNLAGDISGVSSWLLRLATHLRHNGMEVAVHLTDYRSATETAPSTLELALRQGGVEIHLSPPGRNLRKDVATTLAFLNRWRPDVFLPQCKGHHYVAAAIAGRLGLPWALTLHSDDADYWAVLDSLPPNRHGGVSVCVSRHIQLELLRRGEDAEAVLIPYGVPIPAQTTTFQQAPFRVIYCGRLWEHQKRISLVISALIKACQRPDTDLQATLIGDGYCREICEQQVREAGLSERIAFLGQQPFATIQSQLLHSQAILLMSDFEGLPVAFLEAMAAGVVPVARAISSGIPELVRQEETGLLVCDDPDQAAAALASLAKDQVRWQRCSKAARNLVRESYNEARSNQLWMELLLTLQKRSRLVDPIQGFQGVRLSRLSPLLTAPYRNRRAWPMSRWRHHWPAVTAILKGRLKQWLRPTH
jgi:colanic acid/amylovoran biosynthesis glycosyltransferase